MRCMLRALWYVGCHWRKYGEALGIGIRKPICIARLQHATRGRERRRRNGQEIEVDDGNEAGEGGWERPRSGTHVYGSVRLYRYL